MTNASSLFDFSNYKAFLRFKTGERGTRKGVKARIATALRCQATYISQVIHRDAHLSLEQADRLNQFFGHSDDESRFFMLLVQKGRAGTRDLERFFQKQIDEVLAQRRVLSKRLRLKTSLSVEVQTVYYSSWHYAAIHMALSVSELQTKESLADYFGLPKRRVSEVLDFLTSAGLCAPRGGRYLVGSGNLALASDSPLIARHHSNWRHQAVASLDRDLKDDLHYSAVISISKRDFEKLKSEMMELLRAHRETIKASPEEEIFCYSIDLFSLRQTLDS